MPVSPFDDLVTRIAFAMSSSKGIYALLLGSGLSRAASIPTGWEITLDLVRRIAIAQGVPDQSDWSAWYREEVGEAPNYSSLLEKLSSSADERRAIIHGYLEPTPQEREDGLKVPTHAHRAIAWLVEHGYVRVIVTTNFDRLMENALRERGIEPTVVASPDALAGAEPLTHTRCFLLKLHGDYKDARILNTDSELERYPASYDVLLDRIIDEHGFIIAGWSGEWDHALRAAFLRAPNRRYSMYWLARGTPGTSAEELIRHRGAHVVPIADADSFFSGLRQRVETIEQSQRQDPLTIEVLVNTAKHLLARPESRIQLEDLISQEAERLLERLRSYGFTSEGTWDSDELPGRIGKYEASSEPLASVAGCLGRWGNGSELTVVIDVIRALHANAMTDRNGLVAYLATRFYPAVLVFYAYGLGLTRAERWPELHALLTATIDREHEEPTRIVNLLFLWDWKGSHEAFKQLKGYERRKTPVSDRLCDLLQVWSRRFLSLTPDFEVLFERFELLASLVHFEANSDDAITEANRQVSPDIWMPIGRAAWDGDRARRIRAEIQNAPLRTALLAAGFARGEQRVLEFFDRNFQLAARYVGR